jgi:hypothetical protein
MGIDRSNSEFQAGIHTGLLRFVIGSFYMLGAGFIRAQTPFTHDYRRALIIATSDAPRVLRPLKDMLVSMPAFTHQLLKPFIYLMPTAYQERPASGRSQLTAH